MKTNFLLAMVLAIGLLWIPTMILGEVPLPDDIKIVPPDGNVPEELRGLSGKWTGNWGDSPGGLETVLILEKIRTEEAEIIYALGDNRGMQYAKWGRFIVPLQKKKGKIVFSFGETATLTFTYDPPKNKLEGKWDNIRIGRTMYITMKPIPM